MSDKQNLDLCVYINSSGEYRVIEDMVDAFKPRLVLKLINTSRTQLNKDTEFNVETKYKFRKPQALILCNSAEMHEFVKTTIELYRKNVKFLEQCYKL